MMKRYGLSTYTHHLPSLFRKLLSFSHSLTKLKALRRISDFGSWKSSLLFRLVWPSKSHTACLIKQQASESGDSKEKTFREAPPWEGKEDKGTKKFKTIRRGLVFLSDGEKRWGERRRTEVERNMNMGVDKEWVRRTCRFCDVPDIHWVTTNVFVCHIDILPRAWEGEAEMVDVVSDSLLSRRWMHIWSESIILFSEYTWGGEFTRNHDEKYFVNIISAGWIQQSLVYVPLHEFWERNNQWQLFGSDLTPQLPG